MFNPIVGMLHNTKLERWHPIVFQESPLPGGTGPVRHKSSGHHTAGFDTREAAITHANELIEKLKATPAIEKDFAWDGEDIPAMVTFFIVRDGKAVPAF
jgi:hypothetical protein